MNRKEADDIAYELSKILEDAHNVTGLDRAKVVSNTAMDSVHNIVNGHPKIKEAISRWLTSE